MAQRKWTDCDGDEPEWGEHYASLDPGADADADDDSDDPLDADQDAPDQEYETQVCAQCGRLVYAEDSNECPHCGNPLSRERYHSRIWTVLAVGALVSLTGVLCWRCLV